MKAARYFCAIIIFIAGPMHYSPGKAGRIPRLSVQRREIIRPRTSFNESGMETEFRRILTEAEDSDILLVEALDSQNSANLVEMGVDDASYALWETLYSDYKQNVPPFGELLRIKGNATMRLRDDEGHVRIKVLKGEDAYRFDFCGRSFSLAHLAVKTDDQTKSEPYLHFFLTTDGAPDERITRCAHRELQSRLSNAAVNVSVRNDAWFLLHSDYPVVLPFLSQAKPPTKEEYEGTPEWSCGQYEGHVLCSGGRRRGSPHR
jgi:hypothetical protein